MDTAPRPRGVAVTPDGTHAYIANDYFGSPAGTVSVIATATNTVVKTIAVGKNPLGVAITPDGAHVYVTNNGASTVSVIATATNTVVKTIPVGSAPQGVAIGIIPVTRPLEASSPRTGRTPR